MFKYIYLIMIAGSIGLMLSAAEKTVTKKSLDKRIKAATKGKTIFFSEGSYFKDDTKEIRGAPFSKKDSFKRNIVAMHHPFCTKDLGLITAYIAYFELKEKPSEKQIAAIVKHFQKFKDRHADIQPVIYFEALKIEEDNGKDRVADAQARIIGYGTMDVKQMRGGLASNDDIVKDAYFTKESFIPREDD